MTNRCVENDRFLDKPQVRGVGNHFVFSLHKSADDAQITDGETLGVGALVFLKVKIREHSRKSTTFRSNIFASSSF